MKYFIYISILCLSITSSYGQSTSESILNATGGTSEKNNIIYEWSVGELCMINTMESDDRQITLTNGCLQPAPATMRRSRNTVPFDVNKVRILPNPATDKVTVHFRFAAQGKIKLVLYDESGEIVYAKIISYTSAEHFETIHIRQLRNGTYFLNMKMTDEKDKIITDNRTFKIVKIS